MPRTLTLPELRSIRRMLRTGCRHTEIARLLDISVGTVTRIATDRRLRYRRQLADGDLPEDEPPPDYQSQNLRRCPDCGGMVYVWPCLTCRMRGHAGEARS
jgi:hypothetical protein